MTKPEECSTWQKTGRHDWRVDPQQVIGGGSAGMAQVEVVCATCLIRAIKETRRRYTNRPDDPKTWRPFLEGA